MKSALKLAILVFSFLALLSACGGGSSTPPASTHKWTWVSGSNTVGQAGIYGTQGTADSTNVPGSRFGAVSWIDSSGNLWLFGGWSNDSASNNTCINDLWKYDPTTLEWTWVSGSSTVNQDGVYGTRGLAAPTNVPGARHSAVSWIDSSGNLWLFGGSGNDPGGDPDWLNDLWKYDPATLEWTWVSGDNSWGQRGIYGTQGTADPTNVPGARDGAVSWIDSSGNLWLFGGYVLDWAGPNNFLNDLWKYDPTTLEWTWVSGGSTGNQDGVYGTRGIAAPTNVPGAREGAVSWIDSSGNLWLFGGTAGNLDIFNDLWKYDPTTLEWTWVSGSNTVGQAGIYGTQGTADPTNVPGARFGAVSWLDSQGKFMLFGGYGFDSARNNNFLNDLWMYDPTTLEWTWVSGSNTVGQAGIYGTQGTADPTNVPGARYYAVSWLDSQGKFILFGGYGYGSAGNFGELNDLWQYIR